MLVHSLGLKNVSFVVLLPFLASCAAGCYLQKSFVVFLAFVICILGSRFLIFLNMHLFDFSPSSMSRATGR